MTGLICMRLKELSTATVQRVLIETVEWLEPLLEASARAFIQAPGARDGTQGRPLFRSLGQIPYEILSVHLKPLHWMTHLRAWQLTPSLATQLLHNRTAAAAAAGPNNKPSSKPHLSPDRSDSKHHPPPSKEQGF